MNFSVMITFSSISINIFFLLFMKGHFFITNSTANFSNSASVRLAT